jgi:hypothetical protein
VSALNAPVTRGTGNMAIVGAATAGPTNTAVAFTDAATAQSTFPGDLGAAIALAFQQTPGPPQVYGVRTDSVPNWDTSLNVIDPLAVQIVALANTPLNATTAAATGAITLLANHVTTISNTGEDGKERIGVAMLAKGATDPAIVAGALATDRMVYIAHKSDQDAAAAVAGTIAGYAPSTSLLLKQVNINTDLFTSTEINTINSVETFGNGPAGNGVNWLTRPALIPGGGVYMGEGYTGNPGAGKKYIDIVRTIDDVSFRLKAQLIYSIGNLRISRAGLRSLRAQMESVLDPLQASEVIDGYNITMPLLPLLDKDPASLTASEADQIINAHANRVVEVATTIDYAGAIHRIDITLKFE